VPPCPPVSYAYATPCVWHFPHWIMHRVQVGTVLLSIYMIQGVVSAPQVLITFPDERV